MSEELDERENEDSSEPEWQHHEPEEEQEEEEEEDSPLMTLAQGVGLALLGCGAIWYERSDPTDTWEYMGIPLVWVADAPIHACVM